MPHVLPHQQIMSNKQVFNTFQAICFEHFNTFKALKAEWQKCYRRGVDKAFVWSWCSEFTNIQSNDDIDNDNSSNSTDDDNNGNDNDSDDYDNNNDCGMIVI